jgi:hypothetical protein
MDEAILPCDFQTAGPIVDDYIYSSFVLPMREGVHVFSLVSTVLALESFSVVRVLCMCVV